MVWIVIILTRICIQFYFGKLWHQLASSRGQLVFHGQVTWFWLGYTVRKNVLISFPQWCFKRKRVEISPCFSSLPRKLYTIFQANFFPDLTMPAYPHKASYFEYRLCHKIFSGEYRAWIIEINCTDDNYFLCDRVCTLSKKLKEDILVVFDQEKYGLENVA